MLLLIDCTVHQGTFNLCCTPKIHKIFTESSTDKPQRNHIRDKVQFMVYSTITNNQLIFINLTVCNLNPNYSKVYLILLPLFCKGIDCSPDKHTRQFGDPHQISLKQHSQLNAAWTGCCVTMINIIIHEVKTTRQYMYLCNLHLIIPNDRAQDRVQFRTIQNILNNPKQRV